MVKPSWAPPPWLFGPVWFFLYLLIAVSFGFVFFMFYKNEIGLLIVLPFVLNLIFNAVFTPLQFGLKNNWLAAVDIVLILLTLVWLVAVIFPHAQWIAYMQIPYLIWVSIATVLQLSIVYLNEGHLPKKS